MQVSQKNSIVYLITKYGYVHLYDIETGNVTATQIKVVEVAVRNSGEGYNESCDLWSLGVVLVSGNICNCEVEIF